MGGLFLLALSLNLLVFASVLEIYFIDVGEGESIYIETPDGSRILVDTGNLITGYRVYRFLKRKDVNKLDLLIITHPHPDHMGGSFWLLQALKVKKRCDNGQPLGKYIEQDIYKWYEELFRRGNYCTLKRGDKLNFGEVSFYILNPGSYYENWNSNSLVIKIVYRDTSILLMGDATKSTERELIKIYGEFLKSDLLKIGHHGAEDATSIEFIDLVAPKYAVISIDKDNSKGYPSPNTINLLNRKGIKVYKTYEEGTITFISDGASLKVGDFSLEILKKHYNFYIGGATN